MPKITSPIGFLLISAILATASLGASSGANANSLGVYGFLYSGGSFTQLGAPGACVAGANGINDAGRSSGLFLTVRAHTASSKPVKSLPHSTCPAPPPHTQTALTTFGRSSGYHPALAHSTTASSTRAGASRQLDIPGATLTEALGINDAGQIVGFFGNSTAVGHGFLYNEGNFTQLDAPGAIFTYADGINDAGQIVGIFDDSPATTASSTRTGASRNWMCQAQPLLKLPASMAPGRLSGFSTTARKSTAF